MNRRKLLIFLSLCLTLTTIAGFIYLALVLHDYITFWIGLVTTLIYGGILSIGLLNFNRISKWEEIPEELQKIRWFYNPTSATGKHQFIYPPQLFI
ncbi:hypothetical protein AAFF39_00970 [Lactococcus garvieae]